MKTRSPLLSWLTTSIWLSLSLRNHLAGAQIVSAEPQTECDCGFIDLEDPTGSIWTDLWEYNFVNLPNGIVDQKIFVNGSTTTNATSSQYPGRIYEPSNVVAGPNGIQLLVQPPANTSSYVPSAEIFTKSLDFGFGVYHAVMQLSAVPGTVSAVFTYLNANDEVDIEYVSKSGVAPSINYAVKPQIYQPNGDPDPSTVQVEQLPFDPSANFHHYSYVWLPNIVHYGLDGVYNFQITTNVPQQRGSFIIAHWSDGSSTYSGGPPSTTATMTVQQIWAFYNASTSSGTLACQKSQLPCTRGTTFPATSLAASDANNPVLDTAAPGATRSAILAQAVTTTSHGHSSSSPTKKPSAAARSMSVSVLPLWCSVVFAGTAVLFGMVL